MLLAELREQVVRVGMEAFDLGIVHGTAGNMSIRDPASGLIAISPSGIPYPAVTVHDVVIVDDRGNVQEGFRKPSSETPLHTMVYRQRPHVNAIVHTHSHFSTVVSTIRDVLPPIQTEITLVIGSHVPVTRYGLTGTPDFGESVLEVLDHGGRAVILRNHGLIAFGKDIREARMVAEIVEEAAKVYVHALAANGGREPNLVPEDLIPEMRDRFLTSYGQPTSRLGPAGAVRTWCCGEVTQGSSPRCSPPPVSSSHPSRHSALPTPPQAPAGTPQPARRHDRRRARRSR